MTLLRAGRRCAKREQKPPGAQDRCDGSRSRTFTDAAGAVITGWEGNHPMPVPCFVVTRDVPIDVPDGPTQFTYVTDGISSAVRQAKDVAGERGLDHGRRDHCQAGA
jgi:hypothetical protein